MEPNGTKHEEPRKIDARYKMSVATSKRLRRGWEALVRPGSALETSHGGMWRCTAGGSEDDHREAL